MNKGILQLGIVAVLARLAQEKAGEGGHVVPPEEGIGDRGLAIFSPQEDGKALLIQLPGELAENFNASVKGNALCSVRLKVFKVDGPLPILPVICRCV